MNNWIKEYENLPVEEKKLFSSIHDYLGSMGKTVCQSCGEVFEYDEVSESGCCFDCEEDDS